MRIKRVESFAVRAPRDVKAATGFAGSPTALTGHADYRWSEAYPALYSVHFETALVKVTLANGQHGWGEAQAPLAPQVACTIIETLLAPVLEGMEVEPTPTGIERVWNRLYSTMRVRGQTGGFMLDAISGVDLALWDLAGKQQQARASDLVQSVKDDRAPAYLSGLPGESAMARVESAKPYVDEGFTLIKLYFDRTPQELLETIDAMQAVFPSVGVAVDALWRFTLPEAIAFGRELDARKVRWFECPLLPEFAAEHAALASKIRTPIALGESYRTRFELKPFLEARSACVLQPDLGRSGLTESLQIARAADEIDGEIVPHVSIAAGPQICAALHLWRAADNCPLVEYNPHVLEWANQFLRIPIRMEDAHYVVPEEAGLGVALEEIPRDYVLGRSAGAGR
jgi:L-alanine-DL-glutamate epimerase-like enolase superfamily enzyme